ncbi:phage tail tube protein [Sphingomonas sp. 1P06PA]|uniref:phage tail tube protein n=1 Tax=Sphingomonas sp. 1P06PA TaxID=554121 RepID=UPI0039A680A5
MSDAKIGYGGQFWIHNGTALTKIAEVTSISLPNEQVDDVEVTHLESPNRTREYIAGMIDPGEITIEMNYIAGSASDDLISEAKADAVAVAMKIVVPATGGDQQFTFNGIIKGYERSGLVADEAQMATLTVRIAGAVTQAAAA